MDKNHSNLFILLTVLDYLSKPKSYWFLLDFSKNKPNWYAKDILKTRISLAGGLFALSCFAENKMDRA